MQAANALFRQISTSEAINPRRASSSFPVLGAGSADGISITDWSSICDCFRTAVGLLQVVGLVEEDSARNTRS